MYPDGLIKINGEEYVTLYGLCIIVGIICCIFTLRFLGKKMNVNNKFIDSVETLAYFAIFIGLISATLFQGLYNFIDGKGFSLNGGLTFIGGLIGGVVSFIGAYLIFRKKFTGRISDILPIAPACIVVAHGFGRIGCFFAGCCGGIKTDSWLGIQFPGDSFKTYPTQLFEAIFLFILFVVFFILVWKKKFRYSFPVYLLSYGVWRFLIEFIRGDYRGALIKGISPSQLWSIVMVVLAVPLYFFLKYLYKCRDKELLEIKEKEQEENAETLEIQNNI